MAEPDTDMLEAIRTAKRKHSPETFLETLHQHGYTIIAIPQPDKTWTNGEAQWNTNVDTIFALENGTIDVGLYDDLNTTETETFCAAMTAAIRHQQNR